MCLLVLAWKSHPRYRLVVAANRDEFHERPAAPLAWWQDDERILAGRDLRGGGTWMGVSRAGRVAVVTNFRELERPAPADAPSRGQLVAGFLATDDPPGDHVRHLQARSAAYAGFNLLAGDGQTLHYTTNRAGGISRELAPGLHGLSNHVLDSPWPKLLRTRARLAEALEHEALTPEPLFDMLADRAPADEDEIPDTGLPPDWERALSAPFVVHPRYGTRCSTLLLVSHDGHTTVWERRFDADGRQTGATRRQFRSASAA
jgi:uncharacterized protein with NRDE domain